MEYTVGPRNPYGDGTDYTNITLKKTTVTLPDGRMSQQCFIYDGNGDTDCTGSDSFPSTDPQVWGPNVGDTSYHYPVVRGSLLYSTQSDYGIGAPGPILLKKRFEYKWQSDTNYLVTGLMDRISKETLESGSGISFGSTINAYDEILPVGSLCSTCGYQTTVTTHPNVGPDLVTKAAYDIHGMQSSFTDANNKNTTFTYDSTGIFPLLITSPTTTGVAHTVQFTHDAFTGSVLTRLDSNGQTTTNSYDSIGRIATVKNPDLSNTAVVSEIVCYPDIFTTTVIRASTSGLPVPSTDSSICPSSAGADINTVVKDSLGRVVKKQHKLASGATATTESVYDSSPYVQATSLPYTDSPSAWISSKYDVLGRVRFHCEPDNAVPSSTNCEPGQSYQEHDYSGNTETFKDESRKSWTSTADSVGRLTKVVEPGGFETIYVYDPLGNLNSVSQRGAQGEAARVRTFSYDSSSRLICSSNPETNSGLANQPVCPSDATATMPTGATIYSYDGNGNLKYKTDARGVITSYTYDALNRVLSKTYTNNPFGTASSCYQYDASSVPGAGGNLVGRLTNAWTQKGNCPSSGQPALNSAVTLTRRSMLSYDPMGRLLSEQQCTKVNCTTGAPYNPIYDYDLAGNLIHHSNGIGTLTFTNCYDAAGQLSLVLGVSASCSSPTGMQLFSSPSYTAAGGLSAATYGTGLTLSRTYDSRLRITGETDTGNSVANPTPGTAKITITGTDQTH
jgi:YD repeat-containing protein